MGRGNRVFEGIRVRGDRVAEMTECWRGHRDTVERTDGEWTDRVDETGG
jgi:hypothetical protein